MGAHGLRRFRKVLILAAVGIGWASVPTVLLGQRQFHVTSPGSCQQCRISLTRATILRSPSSESAFTSRTTLVQNSRGVVFLAPVAQPGQVLRFSSSGAYLGSFGEHGERSGTLGVITTIVVDPADSLHVFDRQKRQTVFSPVDLSYARHSATPASAIAAVILPPGNSVIHADIRTPGRVGFPVHMLDEHGAVQRSFGAEVPEFSVDQPWLSYRSLAKGGTDRTLWLARFNQYRIEQWDTAGTLVCVILRDAPWFPTWRRWNNDPMASPPLPRLLSVREDHAGRLWVLIGVADSAWQQTPARDRGRDRRLSASERSRFFDTIVEVIDLRSGRLLASRRHPDLLSAFVSDDLVFLRRNNGPERNEIELWRVGLIEH